MAKPPAKPPAEPQAEPQAEPSTEPDSSPVAAQYEKWVYPLPVMDLGAPGQRERRERGDPGRNWHTFWPNQAVRDDLDILVAGCGTNAAARYAFHYPNARVVGIDLSSSSLAHAATLKDKHGLANLTLHRCRLEEVASLGQTFDFIDCSGVLHHLPDPVAGLRALGGVLRPTGTIAVMVYARYGRAGLYMLREMFQVLGLGQTDADVAFVRETLAALPEGHPVHESLSGTQDVTYDAGLVDTFLHPQDRAYTVAECLDLVRQAGLSFMGWWDNILRYAEGQVNVYTDFCRRINAMPDAAIWQFMELYNGRIGQHTFCVCLPSRPLASYRIDFAGDAFLDYVPVARSKEVAGATGLPNGCIAVQRANLPRYVLTPAASALYRQIDGARAIRACFVAAQPALAEHDREAVCRDAFQYLWRLSSIFLRLPG